MYQTTVKLKAPQILTHKWQFQLLNTIHVHIIFTNFDICFKIFLYDILLTSVS